MYHVSLTSHIFIFIFEGNNKNVCTKRKEDIKITKRDQGIILISRSKSDSKTDPDPYKDAGVGLITLKYSCR